MSQELLYMYPKSPRDIGLECARSASPEVMRFDGQNHLWWTSELPDGLGCYDDGHESLMQREDFRSAFSEGIRDREKAEGIRRDLIEGSIMPILDCDRSAAGLPPNSEETK